MIAPAQESEPTTVLKTPLTGSSQEPAVDSGEVEGKAPSFGDEMRRLAASFKSWPRATQITLVSLLALYAPVIYEVSQVWLRDDTFAHGFLIIPVCLFLLYMNREEIRNAEIRPTAWGIPLIAFGLLLETASYLLQVKLVAMFSLIPTLVGVILALHGPVLLRHVAFTLVILFFAVPLPDFVIGPFSNGIQHASSTGASVTMRELGYTISQSGNIIDVPGVRLEVAEVCSGFKKLVAMWAFSLLYGYIFVLPMWKRAVLFLAALPIALGANIIRISGLIAVATSGGESALHVAHDWAEIFVLVIAFFFYVMLGKALGCKRLRFSE